MSDICEHETFKDICGVCHRDARITILTARVEELEGALKSIKWLSADKDNMEFSARITCWQMDAIRAAFTKGERND